MKIVLSGFLNLFWLFITTSVSRWEETSKRSSRGLGCEGVNDKLTKYSFKYWEYCLSWTSAVHFLLLHVMIIIRHKHVHLMHWRPDAQLKRLTRVSHPQACLSDALAAWCTKLLTHASCMYTRVNPVSELGHDQLTTDILERVLPIWFNFTGHPTWLQTFCTFS